MSNFTKSIVYSCIVLVAGIVGSFSIYNNMVATNNSGAEFATLEPAAGDEATTTDGIIGSTFEGAGETLGVLYDATSAEAQSVVEGTLETIDSFAENASDSVLDGVDSAQKTAEEILNSAEPAAGDVLVEDTSAAETKADEALKSIRGAFGGSN